MNPTTPKFKNMNRVRIQGGPFVEQDTRAQVYKWSSKAKSVGVVLDRLTKHGKATGFDPSK